jgi:F-type H+-transporting ATPase subunit alpha
MFRNALRQSSRTAVGALTATGRVRVGAPVLSAVSKQARSYASESKPAPTEVSSILEQRIRGVQEEAGLAETGRVLSVGSVAATRNRSSGSPTNS